MVNIKVLIIGIVASGKTTLAKRLSLESNIKYYEIDSIVHDDTIGRKRSFDRQQKIIREINKYKDWIIEGTLRKNLDNLLDYADIIVIIDIPLYIRYFRIVLRYIKQKLGIEKCNYKPTIKMVKMMYQWTRDFENNKGEFENRLFKYKDKIIRLDTVKKVNSYSLNNI